jgi:glutaredoxin
MLRLALIATLSLSAAASVAGQLYRWVDADGRVHYSDQLPPVSARQAERKQLGDKPPAATLPFALKEATRNFPVTLYTAEGCGAGCEQAAAYLNKRGVPYTERDARDPAATKVVMALTGGKLEVPLLTVGNGTVLRGYQENAWSTALDTAGYPASSILPAGMSARRAPSPAPVKAAEAGKGQAVPPAAANPPPATN